jgi:hypothetical protein
MKKIFFLSLTLSVAFIYSCKDDSKTDTPVAKTKTQLLSASPWKLVAATVDPAIDVGGTQVTDWYSQMDACDKDDLTKYETNKTGVYDEGATKCDPSDPQSTPFAWTFDLSETKITVDGESYDIVQLDATTLKMSNTVDGDEIGGISGLNYKVTITNKH